MRPPSLGHLARRLVFLFKPFCESTPRDAVCEITTFMFSTNLRLRLLDHSTRDPLVGSVQFS